MPKSQNRVATVSARAPGPFFKKQLQGEEPLSFETGERVCRLAGELLLLRPWEFLGDEDLVLMEDPQSQQICYCSMMGALGEVISLQVYVGTESYRLFRKVSAGEPITPQDFFASLRGVSVEFVGSSELTAPDRDVLRAFDFPAKRSGMAPMFRAHRPGYHPWYVTEGEAKLLAWCMQCAIVFYRTISAGGSIFWDQPEVYPFLVPIPESQSGYEIRRVSAPEPPLPPPRFPEVDETLLAKVREMDYPVRGALELDHFFTAGIIGGKHERKACVRVGLATEAQSGFLFPPELGSPQDSTGDILLRVILNTIRTGRFVPQEIRVRHKEFQVILEGLAQRLGSCVRVAKILPALDQAKKHLLAFMGAPADE
jgi:hypothetical protein